MYWLMLVLVSVWYISIFTCTKNCIVPFWIKLPFLYRPGHHINFYLVVSKMSLVLPWQPPADTNVCFCLVKECYVYICWKIKLLLLLHWTVVLAVLADQALCFAYLCPFVHVSLRAHAYIQQHLPNVMPVIVFPMCWWLICTLINDFWILMPNFVWIDQHSILPISFQVVSLALTVFASVK